MLTAVQVLAQNNFGDTRTGGLAGPMGLFLILVLGAATVLLIRNMNARLRRLPAEFPRQDPDGHRDGVLQAVSDPTDGTLTADSSTDVANRHQQRRDG